ncbi:MAG: response regulator [Planctomycetota bacterium]|nr:MAG: response regulator [Planctomycetota bacterium]
MKRIVIADDSATARMFVQRCLEIAGLSDAEFVLAGNGVEALAAMRVARTHLLVTDLTMPEMDGLELVRRVAASPRLNGTPVLVVSSSTNDAVRDQLLQACAHSVLKKPISPPVVIEALESLRFLEEDPLDS